MNKALDIANYIIEQCDIKGKAISNLKLQKILYFVQAEFLVAKNKPCFDENIEALDFGPIVYEVYCKYRIYGGSIIPVLKHHNFSYIITKNDQEIINRIIDECIDYPVSVLMKIIHNQTPWINAYNHSKNTIISKESIKKFFKQ